MIEMKNVDIDGNEINFGDTVEALNSGFRGKVTAFVLYLNGCNQAQVQPEVDRDGKYVDSYFIDLAHLRKDNSVQNPYKKLQAAPAASDRMGGPDIKTISSKR